MLLIFSEHTSNRFIYVLDFIFKSKGIHYTVTNSISHFEQSQTIKINYSENQLNANLSIIPQGILFESGIKSNYEIQYFEDNWLINGYDDVFSIIFYFLSRYEEYIYNEKDIHDRFSAKHSFITKNNRLNKPNVDILVKSIFQILNINYEPVIKQYRSIFTFDIDSAWAVKNKGLFRSFLSDVKDLSQKKWLNDKFKVRLNQKKDPFDTFDLIKKISKNNDVICFFLLADWGKYDKNINWKNKNLQLLINDLKQFCRIGIHPSYNTYLNYNLLQKETKRLETIINESVVQSRQHFLRFKLPDTYENLIKTGITNDYSMGFADFYGFRAGTCFPFHFFNLKTNKKTPLLVHPITYMDGTLKDYLNLSITESTIVVKQLKAEVKNVGGYFIPLWHNETINNKGEWEGWLEVFKSNFED
jgi:hypothetical protein